MELETTEDMPMFPLSAEAVRARHCRVLTFLFSLIPFVAGLIFAFIATVFQKTPSNSQLLSLAVVMNVIFALQWYFRKRLGMSLDSKLYKLFVITGCIFWLAVLLHMI